MSITVTPAGSISLCRTNLENDYKNTLSWASASAQTTYFNNLPRHKKNVFLPLPPAQNHAQNYA